jgi:hypothetical protein
MTALLRQKWDTLQTKLRFGSVDAVPPFSARQTYEDRLDAVDYLKGVDKAYLELVERFLIEINYSIGHPRDIVTAMARLREAHKDDLHDLLDAIADDETEIAKLEDGI